MEQAHDLIRPWRRATIAVSAVAAFELLLLSIVGIALFGKPLLHHFQSSAAAAATPPKREAKAPPAKALLPRSEVVVMVLNGNGQAGAAHAVADRVQAKGYLLGNVGNAPRIMAQHRAAVANIDGAASVPSDLLTACRQAWDDVLNLGEVHGYRNAQATVLAPTGTISFMSRFVRSCLNSSPNDCSGDSSATRIVASV